MNENDIRNAATVHERVITAFIYERAQRFTINYDERLTRIENTKVGKLVAIIMQHASINGELRVLTAQV